MTEVHLAVSETERSSIATWLKDLGLPQNISADTFILCSESKGFLLGVLKSEDEAFLSYIYVEAQHRRQGVASALLSQFISTARERGFNRIVISGHTGNAPGYIQPGINLDKEKEAFSLVQKFGFREIGSAYSMERSLQGNIDLPANGDWQVREPKLSERNLLLETIASSVPGEWSKLFDERLQTNPSQILVAINNGVIAAYSSWNQERFGPIGVHPLYRGQGLGKLLLSHSLNSMKENGAVKAWFSWSDEENLHFYQNNGFQIFRRYARFTLDLKIS